MSDVKTVSLDLHINEIQSILNVLGDLPSKSGAWPLMMKIKQQVEAQLPSQEAKDAEAA